MLAGLAVAFVMYLPSLWAIRYLDRLEPEPPLLFWGSIAFVILFAPVTSRVMHGIIDAGLLPYWVVVGPLEELTKLLPLLLLAWFAPSAANSMRDGIVYGVPSHYHDDHLAGVPWLQREHGTEAWIHASFAAIVAEPARFDLPCLLADPIRVDRVLADGDVVEHAGARLEVFHMPGHTEFALGLAGTIDGVRVAYTGDNLLAGSLSPLRAAAPIYRNVIRLDSIRVGVERLIEHEPELLLSGHTGALEVTRRDLDDFVAWARELELVFSRLTPVPGMEDEALDPYVGALRPVPGIGRGRGARADAGRRPQPCRRRAARDRAAPPPAGLVRDARGGRRDGARPRGGRDRLRGPRAGARRHGPDRGHGRHHARRPSRAASWPSACSRCFPHDDVRPGPRRRHRRRPGERAPRPT